MADLSLADLATVTGGATAARKAACLDAWIADIPSARRDWGRSSAAYFHKVHPNPSVCETGSAPVSTYWGRGAAARTIASGTPYFPTR